LRAVSVAAGVAFFVATGLRGGEVRVRPLRAATFRRDRLVVERAAFSPFAAVTLRLVRAALLALAGTFLPRAGALFLRRAGLRGVAEAERLDPVVFPRLRGGAGLRPRLEVRDVFWRLAV
jgi:hypothetical protein